MEKLIVGPLEATRTPTLIIIDALDECRDEEPASAILSVLSRYVDQLPRVKFFITGRPEPRIRTGFRLKPLVPVTEVLKLHEVKPEAVDRDIELFFRTQLDDLARNRSDFDLTEEWPSSSDIKILCKKAAGFFIYASTVVRFIASESNPPTERLTLVTSLPQSTTEGGKSGVDQLYKAVLQQGFGHLQADGSQEYHRFKTIVGTVVLLFNPLSIKGLSDLLGCTIHHIRSTIRPLHSLLLVPDNAGDPIRIFHKSFPDFLVDPGRCQDKQFFVEPAGHHEEILLRCLGLMEKRLRKNICNLDDYAVLSEVKDLSARKKAYIGEALEYACKSLTKHLLEIPGDSPCADGVQKAIKKFFTVHLLHWIEVLALTNDLGIGIYAMNDVQQWYNLVSDVVLVARPILTAVQAGVESRWTSDTQRLLLEHFDIIRNSPSHIYHSALPLFPSSSWLCKCYSAGPSPVVKVVKGLPAEWGACSRTVFLSSYTWTLSYHDGTIAIGSKSGDIIILNSTTGIQTAVLSGHTNEVMCVEFSSDGALLVSGSSDKTVKLWDIQTGGVVKTFFGHTGKVRCVSISMDCTKIASRSSVTICLWDTQTGKCYYTINGGGLPYQISFSPTNPQYFIFVSLDATDVGRISQWDTNGHQIKSPHDGKCSAFSPDGTKLVSCHKAAITVQNLNSGTTVSTFHVEDDKTGCCCFSPDGRLVAVAADRFIYIWDITSSDPHLIRTFIGHTNKVNSIVFSSPSTLISASLDQSIKFWQLFTSSIEPVETSPEPTPITLPLVSSISLQARHEIAIASDVAGIVKTWDISASPHGTPIQSLTTDSRYIDTKLVDSRLIFVWYVGEILNIWNVEKEEFTLQLHISKHNTIDLRISGDGSKIFHIHSEFIQAWDIWTGVNMCTVWGKGHYGIELLAVDGSRVWIEYSFQIEIERRTTGWDFGTLDSPPVELSTDPPARLCLDNTKFWDTSSCRISDTATGKVFFQLPAQLGRPVDVKWNGQYLVVSFMSKEELVLELHPTLLK